MQEYVIWTPDEVVERAEHRIGSGRVRGSEIGCDSRGSQPRKNKAWAPSSLAWVHLSQFLVSLILKQKGTGPKFQLHQVLSESRGDDASNLPIDGSGRCDGHWGHWGLCSQSKGSCLLAHSHAAMVQVNYVFRWSSL